MIWIQTPKQSYYFIAMIPWFLSCPTGTCVALLTPELSVLSSAVHPYYFLRDKVRNCRKLLVVVSIQGLSYYRKLLSDFVYCHVFLSLPTTIFFLFVWWFNNICFGIHLGPWLSLRLAYGGVCASLTRWIKL